MGDTIQKTKRLAALARGGVARFTHRGVVVWQVGTICDQYALAQAIDAAVDDPRLPREKRADAADVLSLCSVRVLATQADDDAPMVATWRRGALGESGLVVVGATDAAAELVRKGLAALIRRRLGLPTLVDTQSSAVA